MEILNATQPEWVNYDNVELDIIHEDSDGIHNSISPTVIKTNRGYEMTVILRSNITSEQYPDGVFHAHPEYHVIKKESIGLIEAQGLFILPGRLEQELNEIEGIIEQNNALPKAYEQFKLVYDETKERYNSGKYKSVHSAMQDELGSICKRILQNTAVFKDKAQLKQFIMDAIQ